MFEHRFYFTPREYIVYYSTTESIHSIADFLSAKYAILPKDEHNAQELIVNLSQTLFSTSMPKPMEKNDVVQTEHTA